MTAVLDFNETILEVRSLPSLTLELHTQLVE